MRLIETLGITRSSKSQVSVMAKELDADVEDFRTRPLDAGRYMSVAADALTMKVREGGDRTPDAWRPERLAHFDTGGVSNGRTHRGHERVLPRLAA